MNEFMQSGNDLGNLKLRSWAERSEIPRYAITGNMYPQQNASEGDYGRTSVFSACIRGSEESLKKFNFADAQYPEELPDPCSDEELFLTVIYVVDNTQVYVE